ncbi:MAG TPA: hypothetical protein VHY08_04375 [Bacillota bacterium]|nr:hypothetical protein [Bacillota bacterium]
MNQSFFFKKRSGVSFCWIGLLGLITFLVYSADIGAAGIGAADTGKIKALFFYSQSCIDCRFIKDEFLPGIKRKYQGRLEIKSYEIASVENFEILLKLEKNLKRKINKTPPLIIIGAEVMEGEESIQAEMEGAITKYLAGAPKSGDAFRLGEWDSTDKENQRTIAQFKNITPLAIIGGGLLDGINPCAFATLIFLISYLTMLGRKRKELLMAGAFFTTGVFIAYFLIGFGLLTILGQVPFFTKLSKWFGYLLAGILGILSLINLYDYVLVRQGKLKEMKLQLGDYFKQKIHAVIRERSRFGTLSAGFIMGFLVALLEFPCTGQVYFPIVLILRGAGTLRFTAFWYLAIYNFMFILPLIGVFGLAYWGITSNQIAQMMMKHMGTVKLLFALFFGILALLLLIFMH